MRIADVRDYGRTLASDYLEAIFHERGPVLAGQDIEPLHRMRVSSRRLRAALRIFWWILPEDDRKNARRLVRRIGRALGQARELDIQLRFLTGLCRSYEKKGCDPEVQRGFKALIVIFQKNRRSAQKRVAGVLNDSTARKGLLALRSAIRESAGTGEKIQGQEFCVRNNKMIIKRVKALLAYGVYADFPDRVHDLHQMRIAAKNLRYTLEIVRPFYGRWLDFYVRAAWRIQDTLGDLHEYDVWLEDCGRLKGGKKLRKAVVELESACVALRLRAYKSFIAIWKDTKKKNIWAKLKKSV